MHEGDRAAKRSGPPAPASDNAVDSVVELEEDLCELDDFLNDRCSAGNGAQIDAASVVADDAEPSSAVTAPSMLVNEEDVITHIFGRADSIEQIQAQLETNLSQVFADTARQEAPVAAPSQEELALEKAANGGHFNLRNTWIGRQWYKDMKTLPAMAEQYTSAVAAEDKERLRAEWARRKLDEARVVRTHSEERKKIQRHKGRYLSFGRIVEEYGSGFDRRTALRCAFNYCSKAARLGGAWAKFDEMAEVVRYLRVKQQYISDYAKCWSLYETEQSKKQLDHGAPTPDTGASTEAQVATPPPPTRPAKATVKTGSEPGSGELDPTGMSAKKAGGASGDGLPSQGVSLATALYGGKPREEDHRG